MKKATMKTETYYTGYNDFMIDIIEQLDDDLPEIIRMPERVRSVWLYRKRCGIKIFVIGELERNWTGKTIRKFAKEIIEYLKLDTLNCGNWYDLYTKEYENYSD